MISLYRKIVYKAWIMRSWEEHPHDMSWSTWSLHVQSILRGVGITEVIGKDVWWEMWGVAYGVAYDTLYSKIYNVSHNVTK